MPSPYPSRSPVSLPGARRCRLARRLAAGLTPAEVAEVEAATEEEILAFVADHEFSRLVAQLPGRPRAALRRAGAAADRDGHGRSPASGRHGRPPRPDVHRLRGQPRPEPGQAAGPAGAAHLRAGDRAQGRAPGRHRPARAASRLDGGLRPASAGPGPCRRAPPRRLHRRRGRPGRAARGGARGGGGHARGARRPERARSRRRAELPALSWSASGEPIAPPGYRIVWVPRHPGVPDLPDELPLSPIAQLAHDFPDFADWFIRRGEQRLAELAKAEPEPEPDRPREARGRSPSGRRRREEEKVFLFFVTLELDPRAHGPARRHAVREAAAARPGARSGVTWTVGRRSGCDLCHCLVLAAGASEPLSAPPVARGAP